MNTFKKTVSVAVLGMLLSVSASPSYAGFWFFAKKKAPEKTEQPAPQKKESKYEKLFKNESARAEGLVTLHLASGKVYFEMPLSLLGREMLMGSTIKSISDNGVGISGAKEDLMHLCFTQTDSTVFLREIDSYYMDADASVEAALTSPSLNPIKYSFVVKTMSPDSSAVVFDATPFFLDDDEDSNPFLSIGNYNRSYNVDKSFKKGLSFIENVKSYEDNFSVTMSLNYSVTMTNVAGRTLVRNKPLTARMTRSFILLPEQSYHPRMADPRIGYFQTRRHQWGDMSTNNKDHYYVNRWRLEPSDTAAYRRGELTDPVKPIVFYIDNRFPEWWKPYIFNAVEQWKIPFEQIGFSNAVQARFFPSEEEDPDFDPDNIRYSCIRYAPIGVQNAMGPSWTDPRSGEIITASVYVYHDIIRLLTDWMYVQTSAADASVRSMTPSREKLGDAIEYVIRHEIGHCMGLMHNMGASASIPVEALRDPAFTRENGTTYSIMDYARFNYVAQPGDMEKGVKITPPMFGKYDLWAIKWAYTPVFDAESFEQETKTVQGWITEALKQEPYHRYGIQQIADSFFDPRNQTEDLGDDVIAATRYGMSNLKMEMENFMDWIGAEDEDFEFRTEIYTAMINQYLRYTMHVLRNVGGLYREEIKSSDAGKFFSNVPAAKQKACLEYVFKLWEDADWVADKRVLGRLPIVGDPATALRNAIQANIMNAVVYAYVSDGVDTNEFSADEVLDFIFRKVWAPTRAGKALSVAQRSFQEDFVDAFISLGNFPKLISPKSFADRDMHHADCTLGCADNMITYDPVSGFGYTPRSIFTSYPPATTYYAALTRVRDLLKQRVSSAKPADRAHYQMLLSKIDYSIK